MANRPIEKVLAVCENAAWQGGDEWLTNCPVHGDSNPSLLISEAEDGKVLITCRSQKCPVDKIVAAWGLTMKDLFPPEPGTAEEDPTTTPVSPSTRAQVAGPPTFQKPIAIYDYQDENGQLLYQVLRYTTNPRFRQRRPNNQEPPAHLWTWDTETVRKIPYRLPEVRSAVALEVDIFIVEGEKDADNISKLGLVATTNSGGAGNWSDECSKAITGAGNVFILPDNDKAGLKHARTVRDALRGKADRVRVIKLPGLKAKGDVSDWIAAGGTRAQLEALCQNPPQHEGWESATSMMHSGSAEVEWLVPDLISTDGAAVLSGESKTFKSWTMLSMAVALATGTKFLQRFDCQESKVMLVSGDEPRSETLRKISWICAGAQMNGSHESLLDKNFMVMAKSVELTEEETISDICDAAADFAPALVIIDSMDATIGGDENSREFGRAARKIAAQLREAHSCAVLFIHHWNKPSREGGKRPQDRLRGHGGLRGFVDHHLALERNGEIVTFIVDANRRGRELPPFDYSVQIVDS